MTLIRSMDSIQVRENDPPPVPVDPNIVAAQLRALALADAQDVLRAARLYATAMELILERPQVAYLLLVSAIEALTVEYMNGWAPSEAEQVKSFGAVIKQARKIGLSDQQARSLALAAAKGHPWIKKKFVTFISDRVGEDVWVDDDLFRFAGLWNPDRAKLTSYLSQIYDLRSKVVHEGRDLPLATSLGLSNQMDQRVAFEFLAGALGNLPPLGWFEKAVNICIRSRINEILVAAVP